MKRIFFISIYCFALNVFASAQLDTSTANTEKARLIDMAEKQYKANGFSAALDNVNKAITLSGRPDGNILYFKIEILKNIYNKSNALSAELETTLNTFFKQVNQFTFPEDKYAEIGGINSNFKAFRAMDNAFADSVKYNNDLKDYTKSVAMSARITDFLNENPNTYNAVYLDQVMNQISFSVQQHDDIQKKRAKDSTDRDALRRAGRRTGINISYAIPEGIFSNIHNSFASASAFKSFFGSTGNVPMSAKYAAGMSFADIVIPFYTSSAIRVSLDWNLIDLELSTFDWSNDTIGQVKTIYAAQAGTRIGPSVTFLLTRTINVSVYYSARPAFQMIVNTLNYTDRANSSTDYLKGTPNFNMSNEIGAKVRFGKFMINPFYHFGKFTWKSEAYDGTTNNKTGELISGYTFSYVGFRIGI